MLALLVALPVIVTGGTLRHKEEAQGVVQAIAFHHHLRVCNAYPLSAAVDVFLGKHEKLTGEDPIPYKDCRDFSTNLKSGDKLEFKLGDATTGSFAVADLPQNDAVLLLVVHRHDTVSTAVAFESHVFANTQSAQVAIIDTYKGVEKGTPRIFDEEDKNQTHSEELRYNSVVAVNPGKYEVVLAGQDGKEEAKSELVALNQESYVVIRTGVETQQGTGSPQELLIYPHSDALQLRSGAVGASLLASITLALSIIVVMPQ